MRLVKMEVAPRRVPLTVPYRIAGRRFDTAEILFVILRDETGAAGYGSASPVPPLTGDDFDSAAATLENAIRPIFIGNGFGNYADRLHRDDVRFVLTYDLPRLGYESSDGSGLIEGVLARYPKRAVIATFEVDETPLTDRAVLVDKFGDVAPSIGPQ